MIRAPYFLKLFNGLTSEINFKQETLHTWMEASHQNRIYLEECPSPSYFQFIINNAQKTISWLLRRSKRSKQHAAADVLSKLQWQCCQRNVFNCFSSENVQWPKIFVWNLPKPFSFVEVESYIKPQSSSTNIHNRKALSWQQHGGRLSPAAVVSVKVNCPKLAFLLSFYYSHSIT